MGGLLSTEPTLSSFYFDYKLERLVGGSSVINGDTPSSFFYSFMRLESCPIINEKGWHGICASVTEHFQPLLSLFRICRRFTVSVSLP